MRKSKGNEGSLITLHVINPQVNFGLADHHVVLESGGTVVKNRPASAGDPGSIPGLGRSPGGRAW